MLGPLSKRNCNIRNVGKARNGSERYWCTVHNATAAGVGGTKLDECEFAYLDVIPKRVLDIKEGDFPGGIAIWGAVDPIYNTTAFSEEPGVHVHARNTPNGNKVHDATFDEVRLHYTNDLFDKNVVKITHDVAVAYYVSKYIGRRVDGLMCPHCRKVHLDKDMFAVKPHRRHLCHHCGRFFNDVRPSISNPVMFFRGLKEGGVEPRTVVKAQKRLSIQQLDYPGGIAIWASNPALIWTAAKPEEEGIHVHAYDAENTDVVNDTYATVSIDGVDLRRDYVAALMAQKALGYLNGRVVSVDCPECSEPHFDTGDMAFKPHKDHHCIACNAAFSSGQKLVVCNPLVKKLKMLSENLY